MFRERKICLPRPAPRFPSPHLLWSGERPGSSVPGLRWGLACSPRGAGRAGGGVDRFKPGRTWRLLAPMWVCSLRECFSSPTWPRGGGDMKPTDTEDGRVDTGGSGAGESDPMDSICPSPGGRGWDWVSAGASRCDGSGGAGERQEIPLTPLAGTGLALGRKMHSLGRERSRNQAPGSGKRIVCARVSAALRPQPRAAAGASCGQEEPGATGGAARASRGTPQRPAPLSHGCSPPSPFSTAQVACVAGCGSGGCLRVLPGVLGSVCASGCVRSLCRSFP